MAATSLSPPPYTLGQLVTVDGHGELMPGTVVDVVELGPDRWELRVEVLARFGVGTSRHVVDGSGVEVELPGGRPGLFTDP